MSNWLLKVLIAFIVVASSYLSYIDLDFESISYWLGNKDWPIGRVETSPRLSKQEAGQVPPSLQGREVDLYPTFTVENRKIYR